MFLCDVLDGVQQISDKLIKKQKSFMAKTVHTVKIQDGRHTHYKFFLKQFFFQHLSFNLK